MRLPLGIGNLPARGETVFQTSTGSHVPELAGTATDSYAA